MDYEHFVYIHSYSYDTGRGSGLLEDGYVTPFDLDVVFALSRLTMKSELDEAKLNTLRFYDFLEAAWRVANLIDALNPEDALRHFITQRVRAASSPPLPFSTRTRLSGSSAPRVRARRPRRPRTTARRPAGAVPPRRRRSSTSLSTLRPRARRPRSGSRRPCRAGTRRAGRTSSPPPASRAPP